MNNNPFRPEQPNIPGVTPQAEARKAAEPAEPEAVRAPSRLPSMQMPPLWVILSATSVIVVCLVAVWWMRGTSAKEKGDPEPMAAVQPTADAAPAKAPEKLAVGPGEIATTSELAQEWSSKKFIFRDPMTSQDVPAMVVHLPGGIYWGFSLREPYGTCEMELVTNMDKLRSEYSYRGSHPMVGDPCNRGVFDLTKYGTGPAGLVRGEIVQGAAVRPPLAIEIQVRGKQVIAQKIE
ncbi:MAG: hypothetical protein ACRD59_12650 [Candidatus Acidiferrales bacterium]